MSGTIKDKQISWGVELDICVGGVQERVSNTTIDLIV